MKIPMIIKKLLLLIFPKRLNLFRHKFLVYFSQKNLAAAAGLHTQFVPTL
jgi:hypothetical protein